MPRVGLFCEEVVLTCIHANISIVKLYTNTEWFRCLLYHALYIGHYNDINCALEIEFHCTIMWCPGSTVL